MKIKNLFGQSIIEYGLIIVAVIAGIIFMGPYAIRTINAHFQIWDDQVYDSFSEDIQQHSYEPPVDEICRCKDWMGEKGWRCGLEPCEETQRLVTKSCFPLGCELFCARNPLHPSCCTPEDNAAGLCENSSRWDTEKCVDDNSCCEKPSPVSDDPNRPVCGVIPEGECRSNNNFDSNDVQPPCDDAEYSTSARESCEVGEEVYEYKCGPADSIDNPYRCVENPLCNLGCTVPEAGLDPGAKYCPGDTEGLLDAGATTGLTPAYIGEGPEDCGKSRPDFDPENGIPNKCRVYCDIGYFLIGNSCVAECPVPTTMYTFETKLQKGATITTDKISDTHYCVFENDDKVYAQVNAGCNTNGTYTSGEQLFVTTPKDYVFGSGYITDTNDSETASVRQKIIPTSRIQFSRTSCNYTVELTVTPRSVYLASGLEPGCYKDESAITRYELGENAFARCCDEGQIPYDQGTYELYPCDVGKAYVGNDKCPEPNTFWTGRYINRVE